MHETRYWDEKALPSPRTSPLIGREEELRRVMNRCAGAKEGQAQVVLVAGEPGIGKTRLLDEIAVRAARDSTLVLRGGASEAEGMPPYLPFLEALGSYVREAPIDQLRTQVAATAPPLASTLPELASRLGDVTNPYPVFGEQARFRLYEAIGTFLQIISLSSGLVLLFDDLHWADTASLDLLCHVVRRQPEAHALIVGAYRDSELERNAALRRTITDLSRRRRLTEVAIKPLSRQDIENLATSLLGCPLNPSVSSLLYVQSEGNPFFAEELLHGWMETKAIIQQHKQYVAVAPPGQVPPGIVGALRQRFDRLSTELLDDLHAAAVIGRTFDSPLLAAVQQQEPEVIEEHLLEAVHAHLVYVDPRDHFTFSHDKIRECLYAEVSAARRRRLHGMIGGFLEAQYGQEQILNMHQLATLAFHFVQSRDQPRGVDYSFRAATLALQTGAAEEAIAHYQVALDLLSEEDRRRGDVLLKLGEAALLAGKEEDAERAYTDAQCWLIPEGNREALAQAVHGLGRAYWQQDKRDAARTALEQGLVLLADHPCAEAVEVLIDLSLLLTNYMGQQEGGMAFARQALEMAQLLGDTHLEERARRIMAENLSLHGEDLGAAVQFLEQVLEHAEANGDLSEAAECCLNLAVASYWIADLRRSHEACAHRLALVEQSGQLYHLRTIYTWLALLHASQGRWEDAEQMIERAHPLVAHLPSPMLAAFLHQIHGFLAYQQEAYPLAECELQMALSLAEQDRHMGLGMLMFYPGLLGLVQATTDKREEARVSMAYVESYLERLPVGILPTAPLLICLALTAIAQGDRKRAILLYPRLLTFRGQHYWFLVDRVLGQLARECGDWEAARLHLDEAGARARREGLRPELARTLVEQADFEEARGGQGSTRRARQRLQEALVLFDELGMADSIGRVRKRLRALSHQSRGHLSPPLPANLTQREVSVLTLVAQGKSNGQIAQALGLSEKTVTNHLTHIFNKTTCDNRAAATAFAIRHGLA